MLEGMEVVMAYQISSGNSTTVVFFATVCETILAELCITTFIRHIWRERNSQIFGGLNSAWELILSMVTKQVQSRFVYLNLQTSAEISALWDLPPPHSNGLTVTLPLVQPSWNLLSSHIGFPLGVLRKANSEADWFHKEAVVVVLEGSYKLITRALQSYSQVIVTDNKSLRRSLSVPILSRWKERMYARTIAGKIMNSNSRVH